MKKVIVVLLLYSVLYSCTNSPYKSFENEGGLSYDVYKSIAVPFLDTVVKVSLEFGITSDDDIQKYDSDSLPRLKYSFHMPCPVLPNVKLNSFSFTSEEGNIVPSILYYRTDGRVVHIIDSLPAIFTNDIKKHMKNRSFEIFVECSQSYYETKIIYVNYDIEVGGKQFVKQVKYEGKIKPDRRPKLW